MTNGKIRYYNIRIKNNRMKNVVLIFRGHDCQIIVVFLVVVVINFQCDSRKTHGIVLIFTHTKTFRVISDLFFFHFLFKHMI